MMHEIALIAAEEFVMSQIGRWYTQILFEAETAHDAETKLHGEWLRNAIIEKLEKQARSYH